VRVLAALEKLDRIAFGVAQIKSRLCLSWKSTEQNKKEGERVDGAM
jgi:hypothetical protein